VALDIDMPNVRVRIGVGPQFREGKKVMSPKCREPSSSWMSKGSQAEGIIGHRDGLRFVTLHPRRFGPFFLLMLHMEFSPASRSTFTLAAYGYFVFAGQTASSFRAQYILWAGCSNPDHNAGPTKRHVGPSVRYNNNILGIVTMPVSWHLSLIGI
jgi:hypothetical protein